MLTTSKAGVARFVENCVSLGMRHVVCSPGSRNAALVIAFDLHPSIETVIVTDERSAGFFALGMAQQHNAPVGVVCTSGSAMLNYYPAVAEAFYQCIPLVVISADRPSEWINHGDGQTIVQKGVYTNHIRAEVEIPEMVTEADFQEFDAAIGRAFEAGNGDWKGPIHFNCPITEPMYDVVESNDIKAFPFQFSEKTVFSKEELNSLRTTWNGCTKRLIICGQMEPDVRLLNALVDLCEDGSVAVLVENTANLVHDKFNHCIDRSLSAIPESELENFRPDFLVSLGGAVVSKRIKSFLRTSEIKAHWRVGAAFPEMDTYRKLTHSTRVDAASFIQSLVRINETKHISSFGWKWKQLDFGNQARLPVYVEEAPYSDLTAFHVILDSIPDQAKLHMGNSSAVRYCQLFDPIRSIHYYSNRGTSGIDGSSSTAAGASYASPDDLHVLISGDLSFFYDSNALWNGVLGENLKIVVINNGGGGIFRIIDGPTGTQQLERYFETKQHGSIEHLCKAFDVVYYRAESLDQVESGMVNLLTLPTEGRPALLEVFTKNTDNDPVLKAFFQHFKKS